MKYLVFDIETNGLLDKMDTVHSLVIENNEGQLFSCYEGNYRSIDDGLTLMGGTKDSDMWLIGHNIIGFDLPAIQKIYPQFTFDHTKVIDTLVVSRLLYPNLWEEDRSSHKRTDLPKKLWGSHSLEAWGYRLGLHKGDYKKEMEEAGIDPWAAWNPAMQEYCVNDVKVNHLLWQRFFKKGMAMRAVKMECQFAWLMRQQEEFGFAFDKHKAVDLYQSLFAERERIDEKLKAYFKPRYVNRGLFTPKVNSDRYGYTEGVPFCKVERQPFNPASRSQIASRLIKEFGWKPKKMTEGGQPQVDEGILKKLRYPPCQLLAQRFMVEKRIGQLAEGQNAWLKLEKKGRIHGRVNTLGAVTGRCTHNKPNVAQVPSIYAPFGKQCRELFTVPEGFVLVGADASGLELRCLAHYMAKYDGGAYGRVILEGDIHTVNMEAAGLTERNQAKTFISMG